MQRARQLDAVLSEGKAFPPSYAPTHGWLYAIRKAMGIPRSIVAKRLGISGPAVQQIEKREEERSITLANLQNAAEALNCQFMYAIVPKKPIAQMLHEAAEQAAKKMMEEVGQTMKLEDQAIAISPWWDSYEDLVEELEKNPQWIWRKIE